MKKFFLDCGTHQGQGLAEISKLLEIDNTWQVFSWEANPYTFETIDKTQFPDYYQFYNVAINDYTGTVSLNVETIKNNNCGQGSSIVEKSQWENSMHKGNFLITVDIPCIDLSSWISEHISNLDYLAIKLDIEGAEYKVLEKMIKDNTIDFIDHLFIEWHARFFPNSDEYFLKQREIIKLMQDKNIQITRWK